MTQLQVPITSSRSARIGFWTVAALGPLGATVAWVWYGFAQFEAQTEQCKALAAGTTEAGFAELFGGIPLILLHLVGLIALVALGWRSYRRRGLAYAAVAFVIASAVGIGIAQLLWAGDLFQLGINNTNCVS